MERRQVAVIGSGFSGTILARILHRLGLRVVLIERGSHPRFAIGESSTPLAAICLERLAKKHEMPDLSRLAAYGLWMESMPEVRRGLKRGFTFYRHRRGEVFEIASDNANRLLVAASPDDQVADSHWLREDVDQFLVRQAVEEGVDYRDRTILKRLGRSPSGQWLLTGVSRDAPFAMSAEVLIDGSGASGFLAEMLPIESAVQDIELDTSLVFGHFDKVAIFPDAGEEPYPAWRAAVHHLLEEGWLYELPFDHGVVSAGVLLRRESAEALSRSGHRSPEAIWTEVLGRYPVLRDRYRNAESIRPLQRLPRVQRHLAKASGRHWAVLPHTYCFLDPMFSTGIAWSLLAVERLAMIFASATEREDLDLEAVSSGLSRYGPQLAVESQQMATLLEGTYLAMRDFELFTAQSFLYFATVSFEEVDQRLFPDGRGKLAPAWRGFLAAGDTRMESLFSESKRRLSEIVREGSREARPAEREDFVNWVTGAIAGRNIAGLGDPRRRNLYPIDLDLLVERADLLGLTPQEMRRLLPRLRGLGGAE